MRASTQAFHRVGRPRSLISRCFGYFEARLGVASVLWRYTQERSPRSHRRASGGQVGTVERAEHDCYVSKKDQ